MRARLQLMRSSPASPTRPAVLKSFLRLQESPLPRAETQFDTLCCKWLVWRVKLAKCLDLVALDLRKLLTYYVVRALVLLGSGLLWNHGSTDGCLYVHAGNPIKSTRAFLCLGSGGEQRCAHEAKTWRPPPSQPRLRRPARPRPRPTPAPAHGNAGQETRALSAATTSDDGGATDASPPWPSARAMQRAVRRFASGRPARCRSQQWFLLLASIQLLHQHHTFVQLRPVTHQTGRRLLALD